MASQSQPTTRSRTGLFLSYRDSRTTSTRFSRQKLSRYADADTNDDEQDRLIASSSHVALDVDLPPKWCTVIVCVLLWTHVAHTRSYRVDYSEQVQDILAETQTKSALEKPELPVPPADVLLPSAQSLHLINYMLNMYFPDSRTEHKKNAISRL